MDIKKCFLFINLRYRNIFDLFTYWLPFQKTNRQLSYIILDFNLENLSRIMDTSVSCEEKKSKLPILEYTLQVRNFFYRTIATGYVRVFKIMISL
jgi:hypothetical protein